MVDLVDLISRETREKKNFECVRFQAMVDLVDFTSRGKIFQRVSAFKQGYSMCAFGG